MTLTEFKYILAVAQEKNFGRAADRCFVSQPTLSIAIKKLEEELDVCLFERLKTEVLLTPIGEKIVRQAQKVWDDVNELKNLARYGKNSFLNPCSAISGFLDIFEKSHFDLEFQEDVELSQLSSDNDVIAVFTNPNKSKIIIISE